LSYSIGIPSKMRIIWADMEEVKEELEKFVMADFTENISVMIILGDYGTGKTHSLNYIYHLAQHSLKEKRLKVIFFERPFRNFVEFLERIESFLPLEEIYTIVKRSIDKRKNELTEMLRKSYDEDILKTIMIFEKAHDLVLKFMYPNMNHDLRTILAKLLTTESKEIFDLAKKWLRGVPLSPTHLRSLGVTGRITIANAQDISADYLRVYLSDGGHLLILIDEFEDLGVIGNLESLVSFRNFLDENLPRTKIVITMTDEAFEGLRHGKKVFVRKSYPPLWSRFDACKKVRLLNLNINKVERFLIDYLQSLNKDLKNKVIIDNNALHLIFNYTNGSPRLLSALAEYLCSISGFNGKIDSIVVSTALKEIVEVIGKKTPSGEEISKI